jgi:hypothetical protein
MRRSILPMKKKSMRMVGWFLRIIAMAAGIFLYSAIAEAKGKSDDENITPPVMEPNPAETEPNEKFHIYLAFGQSNMVGYLGPPIGTWGSSSSQAWVASNGFDKPPENFVVMAAANNNRNPYNRKKGEWYEAKPPLVRNNTGLSPADFFGRTIAGATADQGIKIGVIAVAVDGCQITLFSKDKDMFINYIRAQEEYMRSQAAAYVDAGTGNSIPAAAFTTGDYPYKRLVDLAKLAQKEGVIKGIIMHQGESGGNLPGKTYAQTVRQIYDDLCGDLRLEKGKVPFLAGQAVGNNNRNISSIPGAFTDIPNTAFVISSDDCPGWNPGSNDSNEKIHFSLDSYKKLGTRYGEKMLELLY